MSVVEASNQRFGAGRSPQIIRWAEGIDGNGPNDCGARAELERGVLDGANLTGFDLANIDRAAVSLRAATLQSASLTGACLDGADLSNTNLTAADLHHASLIQARIVGATLGGPISREQSLTAPTCLTPISPTRISMAPLCEGAISPMPRSREPSSTMQTSASLRASDWIKPKFGERDSPFKWAGLGDWEPRHGSSCANEPGLMPTTLCRRPALVRVTRRTIRGPRSAATTQDRRSPARSWCWHCFFSRMC
jgi:hypothetical protein